MDPLIIEPSSNTPGIHFDFDQGKLTLSGIMDPELPHKFFEDPLNKLRGYMTDPPSKTRLTFDLEYIRPQCVQYLLEILGTLSGDSGKESKLVVQWKYEDDDESIREIGEDMERIAGINVEFIPMKA